MNILTTISALLRAIAAAPAASSFLTPAIDSILLAAATFIDRGEEGTAALMDLTVHIRSMVDAGRDPTDQEWATLRTRSDAAHAAIQGAPPPTATT